MNNKLKPQLKNHGIIKDVLRKVDVSLFLSDKRKVETLLIYLPIKNGESNHFAFLELIKDELLHNFALTCREIDRKLKRPNKIAIEQLFKKALSKISQQTAHGELGELILFTILDVYLQAPRLLSKISLKTSSRMPVYGADSIHAQFINGDLRLYLGESKLYTSFSGAASTAVDSIKSAKDKYIQEFNLIDSHLDLPELDDESQEELIRILNPFENKNELNFIHSPCFIGFADSDLIKDAENDEDFIQRYIHVAFGHIDDYFKKIESQGLSINSTTLFILPFSDIKKLVESFVSHLEIAR
ncbi:HamA C-terminal domain-containing protein [Enterobacter cloacae]|uniref:HamA C-terminal domain-containing protein n=1 Tax=Enterobacter cloacae TaxID=550 RepID=UPI0021CF3F4A|nr:DUF1837 domain-containing protein [Enterobacter cloacae]MCU6209116.1 DUF1837 domain-containing protein [Enterobacter cloacae]